MRAGRTTRRVARREAPRTAGRDGVDSVASMERLIVGYDRDVRGDWIAHLACGHRQHVRHRPPFQRRDWVLGEEGRRSRLATPLECLPCDRAEIPDLVGPARSTPAWDETTMPERLRRDHRLGPSTWAVVVVEEGVLVFSAPALGDPPPLERKVEPGVPQAVPPAAVHHIEPLGPVRFHLDLFQVDGGLDEVGAAG